MTVRLVLLFFFLNVFGLFTANSIREHSAAQKGTNIDTVQVIKKIQQNYSLINSNLGKYSIVQKTIEDRSTEGGEIRMYFEKQALKKVVAIYYGEMGKVSTDFYFNADSLYFVYQAVFNYNNPIYTEGSKVESIEENRCYFYRLSMIKWIGKDKKTVKTGSGKFALMENTILEEMRFVREEAKLN
ncbi:MAG: hypothetical protein ACOYN4_03045 [Bacteroidales bacterium]